MTENVRAMRKKDGKYCFQILFLTKVTNFTLLAFINAKANVVRRKSVWIWGRANNCFILSCWFDTRFVLEVTQNDSLSIVGDRGIWESGDVSGEQQDFVRIFWYVSRKSKSAPQDMKKEKRRKERRNFESQIVKNGNNFLRVFFFLLWDLI